jgi:type IV pilus secretin PilQ/predicted competence protein
MEEGLARKIALNLRDMDIIDVLKFLAQKGNLNIVTSRNVSGRVTLTLSDVSIGDVLDIILISNGLAWRKKNNIIYVMTEEEYLATYGKSFYKDLAVKTIKFSYVKPRYAFSVLENLKSQIGKVIVDEASGIAVVIDTKENLAQMEEAIKEIEYKLETRVFDLKYAKAEDVQSLLSQRLDTELVGNIQADRRSNQVIVRALPERLKEVEEIIKMLDKKTPQVLIETRIFKITLNPRFDMGINWEKVFSKSSHEWLRSLSIVGSFPISSEISTPTTIGTVGKFTIGKVNEDEFTVELKALKQVSDVKILANPRILVTDNEDASIHIGEKLAYVTTTTTTGQTTTTTAESVTFVDVGIQLKVTPTINPDGFVRMKIAPEISSKFGDYTTPTGNKIPLINTTRAETVVMVKDGTTVIIGGLRKNEKSRNLKGIPLLMNLPLLGRLFRTESESMINAEIVIFLTPHIVSGDVNVTDAALEIKPFKDY